MQGSFKTRHYENTSIQTYRKFHLKKPQPKTENFQIKTDIFHISAQNIDCGYSLEPPRWGGSNEYPQSMLLSRKKKNNVYPCIPQFYYIKVELKGSILYRRVFVMPGKNQTYKYELRTGSNCEPYCAERSFGCENIRPRMVKCIQSRCTSQNLIYLGIAVRINAIGVSN